MFSLLAPGTKNHSSHSFVDISLWVKTTGIGVLVIKSMPQMANKSSLLRIRGLTFNEENTYIEKKNVLAIKEYKRDYKEKVSFHSNP